MITCEAAPPWQRRQPDRNRHKDPNPRLAVNCAGECPRPEQLLNLFSDKANEECAALWLHLTECRKCRAAFQPILFDTIRDEDLREAEEQLEFATPRPGVCPAVEELANYAVWPACDPILPRQLSDGRRAAISAIWSAVVALAASRSKSPSTARRDEITKRRWLEASQQSKRRRQNGWTSHSRHSLIHGIIPLFLLFSCSALDILTRVKWKATFPAH